MSVEYVGAFGEHYVLTVDDCHVPFITATKSDDGSWHLILDGRFGIDVSGDEIARWMWWVANAMAISAGYSSFGENSKPRNIFQSRMIGLNSLEFEELSGHQDVNDPH